MSPDSTGSTWRRRLLGVVAVGTVAAATWTSPGAAVPAAATPSVTEVAAGPQVARPWSPGQAELGIHVYWEDNPNDDAATVRRKARRLIDQVVGLEANSIAVSFPFFTDSIDASTVRTDARTPTPDRLAILLGEAHLARLRTTLRPLLDQTSLQDVDPLAWRGLLEPRDRSRWFDSYGTLLMPYLDLADRAGIHTVILAAELSSLQDDPRWPALVATARSRFRGELGYSANWDAYPTTGRAPPVDVLGIDAYPFLDIEPTASVETMRQAWRDWLDAVAPGATDRLVLSEVGGAAEAEMVYNPARTHTPGAALDEGVQRRWFTAVCLAARDRGVAGIYWWKLDFHQDVALADPDDDRHDSFLGREAGRMVRECLASWTAAP